MLKLKEHITKLVLVTILTAALPLQTLADADTKPNGTIGAEACIIGENASAVRPLNTNVCDSMMWWGTGNANNAYVVITGSAPYTKENYPNGFVVGFQSVHAKEIFFVTPAGTYTLTLYANGIAPTRTKAGTGIQVATKTITVTPKVYTSPLLEAKPFVTPNGTETMQQPKNWPAWSTKSQNVNLERGAKISQVEFFYHNEKTDRGGIMKFTRLDNVPSQYLVSPEIAAFGIEKAYTSRLSARVRAIIAVAFNQTHYTDTAAILAAQENGDSARLISKKSITINGATGYQLDFIRKNHNGTDRMRHVILKKGTTYYEVIVVVPASEWSNIQQSVNTSLRTIRI